MPRPVLLRISGITRLTVTCGDNDHGWLLHPPGLIAFMASPTGALVIARTLQELGVTVIFGLVGVPVADIAEEAISLGIRFIGFRNEQACSYAATAYGYLTGKPGVCLLVGGPGILHGVAGVSSDRNGWERNG